MFVNNKTRTAKFYDDVRVTHVPSGDPDLKLNPDKLPMGALHLKCQVLEVYTRTEAGREVREMEARGKTYVQTPEFYGQADVVKYVESKEMVIFEGSASSPAVLYRLKQSRDAADAGEFVKYLMTDEARGVFEKHGFTVLPASTTTTTP